MALAVPRTECCGHGGHNRIEARALRETEGEGGGRCGRDAARHGPRAVRRRDGPQPEAAPELLERRHVEGVGDAHGDEKHPFGVSGHSEQWLII